MTVFQDNIRLSSDIIYFLRKNECGEVLLTTSKGIYLQFSSSIIMLTDQTFGLTPIGLGLSRFVDFVKAVNPEAGQSVNLRNGLLQFQRGTLEGNFQVIESTLSIGIPIPEQINRCARVLLEQCSQRSVAKLAAPLLLGQQLKEADPLFEMALPILGLLLKGLKTGNNEMIYDAVRQLLGLGHGLTPSLDDVLMGMCYGLQRFAPQESCTATLSSAIIQYAQSYTNAISAAYLTAVAHGGYFQRLDDAMIDLYNNDAIDITPILEIGSSSGSEMLFGLLLAAKITSKG